MSNTTNQFAEAGIARVCAGEKAAWDRFAEQFAGTIYNVAKKLIRMRTGQSDPEDAKDIAQDVFLKLVKDDFKLLRSYDPAKASLQTWLTVVTRTTAMDFLKRPSARHETVPIDDDLPAHTAHPPAELPDIPEHLLSKRQRAILSMLFAQDMDVADVALALNVQAQTVRSLKHQALARLREHFGVQDKERFAADTPFAP